MAVAVTLEIKPNSHSINHLKKSGYEVFLSLLLLIIALPWCKLLSFYITYSSMYWLFLESWHHPDTQILVLGTSVLFTVHPFLSLTHSVFSDFFFTYFFFCSPCNYESLLWALRLSPTPSLIFHFQHVHFYTFHSHFQCGTSVVTFVIQLNLWV